MLAAAAGSRTGPCCVVDGPLLGLLGATARAYVAAAPGGAGGQSWQARREQYPAELFRRVAALAAGGHERGLLGKAQRASLARCLPLLAGAAAGGCRNGRTRRARSRRVAGRLSPIPAAVYGSMYVRII